MSAKNLSTVESHLHTLSGLFHTKNSLSRESASAAVHVALSPDALTKLSSDVLRLKKLVEMVQLGKKNTPNSTSNTSSRWKSFLWSVRLDLAEPDVLNLSDATFRQLAGFFTMSHRSTHQEAEDVVSNLFDEWTRLKQVKKQACEEVTNRSVPSATNPTMVQQNDDFQPPTRNQTDSTIVSPRHISQNNTPNDATGQDVPQAIHHPSTTLNERIALLNSSDQPKGVSPRERSLAPSDTQKKLPVPPPKVQNERKPQPYRSDTVEKSNPTEASSVVKSDIGNSNAEEPKQSLPAAGATKMEVTSSDALGLTRAIAEAEEAAQIEVANGKVSGEPSPAKTDNRETPSGREVGTDVVRARSTSTLAERIALLNSASQPKTVSPRERFSGPPKSQLQKSDSAAANTTEASEEGKAEKGPTDSKEFQKVIPETDATQTMEVTASDALGLTRAIEAAEEEAAHMENAKDSSIQEGSEEVAEISQREANEDTEGKQAAMDESVSVSDTREAELLQDDVNLSLPADTEDEVADPEVAATEVAVTATEETNEIDQRQSETQGGDIALSSERDGDVSEELAHEVGDASRTSSIQVPETPTPHHDEAVVSEEAAPLVSDDAHRDEITLTPPQESIGAPSKSIDLHSSRSRSARSSHVSEEPSDSFSEAEGDHPANGEVEEDGDVGAESQPVAQELFAKSEVSDDNSGRDERHEVLTPSDPPKKETSIRVARLSVFDNESEDDEAGGQQASAAPASEFSEI